MTEVMSMAKFEEDKANALRRMTKSGVKKMGSNTSCGDNTGNTNTIQKNPATNTTAMQNP